MRLIAREGIDNVRIARIATEAGVSAGLVHYHFASRDALLEEALEHSYERAGDLRLAALEEGRAPAAQRLAAMIDQCLPTDRALHDDFVLWVELWLRSARDPALRPVAARLYARLHAWFAEAIAQGIAAGELRACDVERMADRLLALIDGYGIRVLTEDPQMPLHRARSEVWDALAGDLRLAAFEEGRATAAQRLAAMIDQCLPTDRALHDDFVLWVELWLRSARDPALRPVAARLYARLHAWFAQALADGIASGELRETDVPQMADRLLALIDGYGIRVLTGDPHMPIERARAEIWAAVAGDLGLA